MLIAEFLPGRCTPNAARSDLRHQTSRNSLLNGASTPAAGGALLRTLAKWRPTAGDVTQVLRSWVWMGYRSGVRSTGAIAGRLAGKGHEP